jgi:RimJ/RimL family protein N-acetyltransferase
MAHALVLQARGAHLFYDPDVPDLANVPWPPAPIATGRLILRATEPTDRVGYIELFCDEEARRYLGGALDRAEVESAMPATPGQRPGVFAVELQDEFIGVVTIERRDPNRPGHVSVSGVELEVGYLFLQSVWGNGYATEAVSAVLEWVDTHLPAEPIVLCTQTAHEASVHLAGRLGFQETARFTEYNAEQWFGVRHPTIR